MAVLVPARTDDLAKRRSYLLACFHESLQPLHELVVSLLRLSELLLGFLELELETPCGRRFEL
jgi:hypothetical protein